MLGLMMEADLHQNHPTRLTLFLLGQPLDRPPPRSKPTYRTRFRHQPQRAVSKQTHSQGQVNGIVPNQIHVPCNFASLFTYKIHKPIQWVSICFNAGIYGKCWK